MNNDNNEVVDKEKCLQQIIGYFQGGVGKPEFESKTRARFDALIAKGADPGAVLSRARELKDELKDEFERKFKYPLKLLESEDLCRGLFRAPAGSVIAWCASYGHTTASAAARAIHELAEADPGPAPSEETRRRAREIYRANERELQALYARANR